MDSNLLQCNTVVAVALWAIALHWPVDQNVQKEKYDVYCTILLR